MKDLQKEKFLVIDISGKLLAGHVKGVVIVICKYLQMIATVYPLVHLLLRHYPPHFKLMAR